MWHGNHWTQRTIGQRKTGYPGCGTESTGHNGLYRAAQDRLSGMWHGKHWTQRTIGQRKTGYPGCGMESTGHNGLYGSARQAILNVAWKSLDTTDYMAAQDRLSWMWHGNHWTQQTIGQRKTGYPGCGMEITGHNGP